MLAWLALLAFMPEGSSRGLSERADATVVELVRGVLRDERPAVELDVALAGLDARCLPEVHQLLVVGSVSTGFPGEKDLLLTGEVRHVLLSAPHHFGPVAMAEYAQQLVATEGLTDRERHLAIDMFSAVAQREYLKLVTQLAVPAPATESEEEETLPAAPIVVHSLEQFVVRVIQSDPLAIPALPLLAQGCDEQVAATFLRALRRVPGDQTVQAMLRMLGRSKEFDCYALYELAEVFELTNLQADGFSLEPVFQLLDESQPELAQMAARIAGLRGGSSTIRPLVALLESNSKALVFTVHRSLHSVTGLAKGKDIASWNAWLRNEEAWWKEKGRKVCNDALGHDPALAGQAIKDATLHPLYKDELGRSLVAALSNPEPAVRAAACSALGGLFYRQATAQLQEIANEDVEPVASAAAAALDYLSESSLPKKTRTSL